MQYLRKLYEKKKWMNRWIEIKIIFIRKGKIEFSNICFFFDVYLHEEYIKYKKNNVMCRERSCFFFPYSLDSVWYIQVVVLL